MIVLIENLRGFLILLRKFGKMWSFVSSDCRPRVMIEVRLNICQDFKKLVQKK